MSKIPKSVKEETVVFLGCELTFHVLDTGKKVVDGESLDRFLEYLATEAPPMTREDVRTLEQYIGDL